MSPFSFKEGGKRVGWKGEPKDIRNEKGECLGVSIFPVEDPEQIRVSVLTGGSSYALGERGGVIFPGGTTVLNRDGFRVIDARTRKTIAQVTHREPRRKRASRL